MWRMGRFYRFPIALLRMRSDIIDAFPRCLRDLYDRVKLGSQDGVGLFSSEHLGIPEQVPDVRRRYFCPYATLPPPPQNPPSPKRESAIPCLVWHWHLAAPVPSSLDKVSSIGRRDEWY